MRGRVLGVVLVVSLVGSVAGLVSRKADASSAACGSAGTAFPFAPTRLGTGLGYEPGIEIDSAGTIFVTAHKLNLVREESTRLASFLWRSTDGGATFSDVPSPAGVAKAAWAFEGDLAVDGLDRLYIVDTWAADNHFARYSNHGDTLDLFRPALASYEVDDRPWLAAHHDGYVYYMSNTGYKHDGRLTVHRSTDGGLTFDPVGFTFPRSGWGFLDADPNSDYVYAFVNDLFYGTGVLGGATKLTMWVSADRGATWTPRHVADYQVGYEVTPDHDEAYPTVAVSPVDGSVYALWTDDGRKVMLARSTDHGATWTPYDVTPFNGIFSYAWLTVGSNGDVGIVFSAKPPASGNNYIYAMVVRMAPDCLTDGADAASSCALPFGAAFSRVRSSLASGAVGGFSSQADFFQTEFSPDGALNVVFTGTSNQIFYSKQTAGPNLGGADVCGFAGTP